MIFQVQNENVLIIFEMSRVSIYFLFAFLSLSSARQVIFQNRCPGTVWISPLNNANSPPIGGIRGMYPNDVIIYNIPDSGWSGRFWPKTGCNGTGQECQVGQSIPPCPAAGCQAPAETKVEFSFPNGSSGSVWYDISLVDGYSLPMEIIPSRQVIVMKANSFKKATNFQF